MKFVNRPILGLFVGLFFLLAPVHPADAQTPEAPAAQPPPTSEAPKELPKPVRERLITLDFNNVDLPVFVKFVSEIIGKNFIIDERVRGKVTIFSPTKISVDKVYQVFLSVLDIKGLAAVATGEMIQILPASEVPPERNINVYYLENANADEAAKLLTSLATRTGGPPAAGRPVVKAPGEFEGMIQIIPDKATNALLITASNRDYEMLKEVIKKLDVRRRQVYVEAVIMEVSQDKLRELGTQLGVISGYQSSNKDVTVFGGFNQAPEDIKGLTDISGIDIGVSTVNVKVLLKALQSASDVNVLSMPQILTMNNQKAKIQVGQVVPIVKGTSQVGGVTQRALDQKDVGVILELTPDILEGDRVRMDIRQEISSLADTPPSVLIELGPTINKRETTTTVIASNNQTIVIGGLMRDDVSKVESKIPLLGDIPLIGWLFKFQSKRMNKTNLLIFLTPHVVRENQDLDALLQQKSDTMKRTLSEGAFKNQTLNEQFLNSINPPQDMR